jgi:Cu/Ag efflux protein CusF
MARKLQILAILSALSLVASAQAADTQKAPEAKPAATKKPATKKKPSFEASKSATATATVDSVDLKKRIVTVHTTDGDLQTIEVGSKVKNLDQVKPGDTLSIAYSEYTRVKVYPAGAKLPASGVEAGMASAKPGEKPAGAAGAHVTLTATVEKIDKKTGEVTLKGMSGETRTVTARNKKNLENVEVGDQVVVTHEKSVAASVEAPK